MKKSIDKLAQRIIAVGIAASLFTFSILFGISTITNNSVKADSAPQTTYGGKIMMSESGFVLNGNPMYHVLVWDTESGKSKIYNFNRDGAKMSKSVYQLPASPLY